MERWCQVQQDSLHRQGCFCCRLHDLCQIRRRAICGKRIREETLYEEWNSRSKGRLRDEDYEKDQAREFNHFWIAATRINVIQPNVVQYIEHIDWEDYLYIIMEYIPGGDLGSLINERGHLPESNVQTMAAQLLSALKHLHQIGITHRDIKPDNILIYSRDPFHVKLTDFGLSKMIDSEETFLRTFCGTLLYCAPEVYSEYREYDHNGKRSRVVDRRTLPPQRYGNAVDIWSLAGVLFYSLCGSPPYPVKNGTSYQELLNQIMTQALDIRPLQRAKVSESGIRFVRKMLHVRPEYRATIEELEHSSWLTGGSDSLEMSMEEDEVDMIGDGYIDADLEEGTSQLSINPDGRQINNSQDDVGNESDLTEMEPLEIPNSFDSSNGHEQHGESFAFMRGRGNSNPGGRLFGEVNSSVVGSSGVIPLDRLNLPVPAMRHPDMYSDTSEESPYTTQSEPGRDFSQIPGASPRSTTLAGSTRPNNMPPPTLHLTPNTTNHPERDDRATRSSSLMGAESMVGHLNMHSPSAAASPAASPAADSPSPRPDEVQETHENGVSLRRPREDDTDDDDGWQPPDLPPKRQRRSKREIDMTVPASIFWDPKDRSTHHNNYPRMSSTDFAHYQKWAESKGEKFIPGHKTFDMTMQSFQSSRSRSSSLEPETTTRANSEPTKEEGRLMLMQRDERQLADRLKNEEKNANAAATNASIALRQPVVGNDFQPPKRILAKIIATSNSAMPTIAINVTDPLTSWGRGPLATITYSNAFDNRIPKYSFKILLFKPGFYGGGRSGLVQTWNEQDQDMSFYISTKASQGIWVNDFLLQSYDPSNPMTKSKFWGELRDGDFIDLLRVGKKVIRLRFECFWGKSKERRSKTNAFKLIEDERLLNEIDEVDLALQQEILADQDRRREAERKMLALEKEKEKEALARQAPSAPSFNFNQSFVGAPNPT